MPSPMDILTFPLGASDMKAELPGPILNAAACFSQRLLMAVKHAKPGSANDDLSMKKLSLSYQLVFRQTLAGETGWRSKAVRWAVMKKRLLRAQRDFFQGLRRDMVIAHEERVHREALVSERRRTRHIWTEKNRRLHRFMRLTMNCLESAIW